MFQKKNWKVSQYAMKATTIYFLGITTILGFATLEHTSTTTKPFQNSTGKLLCFSITNDAKEIFLHNKPLNGHHENSFHRFLCARKK